MEIVEVALLPGLGRPATDFLPIVGPLQAAGFRCHLVEPPDTFRVNQPCSISLTTSPFDYRQPDLGITWSAMRSEIDWLEHWCRGTVSRLRR